MSVTKNVHDWIALAVLWLVVIFLVAALGTPQFIAKDEDNGWGGFKYCLKSVQGIGTCKDYPRDCSSIRGDLCPQGCGAATNFVDELVDTCKEMKTTGAFTLIALFSLLIGSVTLSVGACWQFRAKLRFGIPFATIIIAIICAIIAMGVCASSYNSNQSFYDSNGVNAKLGPSFALVVVSWIFLLLWLPYFVCFVYARDGAGTGTTTKGGSTV